MTRFVIAFALVVAAAAPARAQTPDHDAAYAVVTKLFDAMRARDTATMRASFAPGAALQSVGAAGVRNDAIATWLEGVASAPDGMVLDEKLANPVVQVNGSLSSVWVDYWFYAGERFSHCGVDAFVLAKVSGEWKILSVADTRQRDGCPPFPG